MNPSKEPPSSKRGEDVNEGYAQGNFDLPTIELDFSNSTRREA